MGTRGNFLIELFPLSFWFWKISLKNVFLCCLSYIVYYIHLRHQQWLDWQLIWLPRWFLHSCHTPRIHSNPSELLSGCRECERSMPRMREIEAARYIECCRAECTHTEADRSNFQPHAKTSIWSMTGLEWLSDWIRSRFDSSYRQSSLLVIV